MASFDDYESYSIKIEDGEDKKGKYVKYKNYYESPCRCHPETCSHFDGKDWNVEEYKIYEDGKRIDL